MASLLPVRELWLPSATYNDSAVVVTPCAADTIMWTGVFEQAYAQITVDEAHHLVLKLAENRSLSRSPAKGHG